LGRLKSLTDWLEWQNSFHHQEIDLGLDRVRTVYQKLFSDNPPFKTITIAGTNGKGSTAAFLEGIYLQTPFKVGVFSSPHIIKYNERFRINGVDIDNQSIVNAFEEIESRRGNISLTYFEFSTLAAIVIFKNLGVEIAIMEVGLGGRLDSVNILNPDLTIITSIDIDHSNYLGNTREEIAVEKGGIMRKNITCLCGDQNPPKSLYSEAERIGSFLELVDKPYNDRLSMAGNHQRINARLALEASKVLSSLFKVTSAQIKSGLFTTKLAGRMQKINFQKKQFILDVAHNPAAVSKLINSLDNSQKKYLAIFSALGDKDVKEIINIASKKISSWIIVPIKNSRSLRKEEMLEYFSERENYHYFDSFDAAVKYSLKSPIKKVVVFGSFHTVAGVLSKILPSQKKGGIH